MNVTSRKKQHSVNIDASGIAYWMIRLIHDNPFLPLVRNPHLLLTAAGLTRMQEVVEVGCGPGFFTIPAAHIVGEHGRVYAIDLNHRAIKRVREKLGKERLNNVTPLCINASETGLPEESADLVFIFGLRHVAGGLENVLREMHRILRPEGFLSLEKTRGSETTLLGNVEKAGFVFSQKRGRIFRFIKRSRS